MMLLSYVTDPGSADRANEDWIVATPGAMVLLDGAGGPSGLDNGCQHGVAWYVRRLGAALATQMTLQPEETLTGVLASAITATAESHPGCDLGHPGTPSATVVLLRCGREAWDYLVLSDSTLLLQRTDATLQVVCDQRIEGIAAAERQAMARYPIGSADHQRHREAMVHAQRALRNTAGGHWVAAADPAAAAHALTATLPAETIHGAVLLTDGIQRWVDFGLGAWPGLLDTLRAPGPAPILAEVRAAEAADPDGRAHPRAKRADDASLIFVEADTGLQRPGGGR